jgi:hypothetical protein
LRRALAVIAASWLGLEAEQLSAGCAFTMRPAGRRVQYLSGCL